ncbi:hypothetical protein CTT40_03623 [Pseudomonas aeruginosa]|nr:hypothetical protein CTT40_03623 [Pseudomonas aeruginosa]
MKRTSYGGLGARKLVINRAGLRQNRLEDLLGSQFALFAKLPEVSNRNPETVCDGLGQARSLLEYRVQLLTSEHSRGEGLAELHQRTFRGGSGNTTGRHSLADVLGHLDNLLLIYPEVAS